MAGENLGIKIEAAIVDLLNGYCVSVKLPFKLLCVCLQVTAAVSSTHRLFSLQVQQLLQRHYCIELLRIRNS